MDNQTVVTEEARDTIVSKIDNLRAQEREIERQANLEKQRVALQLQEEEERSQERRLGVTESPAEVIIYCLDYQTFHLTEDSAWLSL